MSIIPTEEELITFLRANPHQTYTSISKHFGIEMGTVRDLIKFHGDALTVQKIGTALMVDVKR
ncbi:MAG: hypothetical protein ACQESE_03180 [Nanobdellota archaeon]